MAKFISVLNTHVGLSFWKAVQWDNDLDSLENNPFYTAGVDMSIPKNPGDRTKGYKMVTERSTGEPAGVTMFQLSTAGQNLVALANNTATEKVIEKLTATLDKPDTNE